MSKYTFLFKDNSEDRDCCAYISIDDLKTAHRGIDGKFNIHGACYSKSLKDVNFEDVKTILSESEFNILCNYNGEDLTEIINKILSEDNETFFEEIQAEETEFLMDEYGLTEDEVTEIFDNYGLEYRDRGIVCCMYDDEYDLGYEEAQSLGIIDYQMEKNGFPYDRYFDYAKFGEDLINDDERYYQLEDERVIYLNY